MSSNPAIARTPIPAESLEIEFRGDVKQDAEFLHKAMTSTGIPVTPIAELSEDDARMGAGEVILTIIATAAAKALIEVVADQLQKYLIERMKSKSESVSVRVVVRKRKGSSGRHESIDLRSATIEGVTKFIANVSEAVISAV